MPIASQQKQHLIDRLLQTNDKFGEPFKKGEMPVFSLLGGSWNEYASVVLSLITADTLLSIDRKLDTLLEKSQQLTPKQPPPLVTSATSDIAFCCDKCGQDITVDAAGAGLQVTCPKCNANLIVPQS